MMQAELSTDRFIKLMREVFAQETIDHERRARIYARVRDNPHIQGMELWANAAMPFDEPSVEAITDEAEQPWLFPDSGAPVPPIESTVSPLLYGSQI